MSRTISTRLSRCKISESQKVTLGYQDNGTEKETENKGENVLY